MGLEYDVTVVGLGAFGLSTCLELARKGYSVLALDAGGTVPSKYSAANDLNKIIRAEYSDITYTKLAVEALGKWQSDPIYKSCYVQCGRLMLSPSAGANLRRAEFESQGYQNLNKLGVSAKIQSYNSRNEVAKMFPYFKSNTLDEKVVAKFNPNAGFAHTANSLSLAYNEIQRLYQSQVTFKFEAVNNIDIHLCSWNKTQVKVSTDLNNVYFSKKAVVACGANTARLIDCKDQIHALGLLVTHIVLTDEEYVKYKDMPIFFSAEHGYFFPPDPETKKLKIAVSFADFSNKISHPASSKNTLSLPSFPSFGKHGPLPLDGDKHAKALLKLMLPELAYHKFVDPKICWIADTHDLNFLIDLVPGFDELVYVASGDSGHGAKFMPNIGKYIVQKLEGKLSKQLSHKWRWKEYPQWPSTFPTRAKRLHVDLISGRQEKL